MRETFLSVLFALDVTLLVLLVVAFQFVEAGTPAYAITQVSLVVILVTLVGLVVAIRRGIRPFER
jgi:hypothetical protein